MNTLAKLNILPINVSRNELKETTNQKQTEKNTINMNVKTCRRILAAVL